MIAGLDIFAEHQFEHDCSLKHPGNGRPEFFERHAQWLHACIRHRVWAELLQPAAGLIARQAVRQTAVAGAHRTGG